SRIRSNVGHSAEAARRHALHYDMADVERAVEIESSDFLPELRIGVQEICGAVPAGVVDQERQRPGRGLERIHRALDRVVIGNSDGMAAGLPAIRFDLARNLFRPRPIQVEDADNTTLLAQ